MKLLRFHNNVFAFVAVLALTTIASFLQAQPPSTSADGPEVKKTVTAARIKPQVIYRLPRSSNDAAALHAQAKTENNMLPIDSNMPTSLQLARSNANATAAAQTPSPGPSAQNQLQDTGGRKRFS